MFNFLISGEVNDDAVRLWDFCKKIESKLLICDDDNLGKVITDEFDPNANSDNVGVNFRSPELKSINFQIDYNQGEKIEYRKLMVFGQGRYNGFTMYYDNGKFWSVTQNTPFSLATSAAKLLSKTLFKKYGVEDKTKLFKKYGL